MPNVISGPETHQRKSGQTLISPHHSCSTESNYSCYHQVAYISCPAAHSLYPYYHLSRSTSPLFPSGLRSRAAAARNQQAREGRPVENSSPTKSPAQINKQVWKYHLGSSPQIELLQVESNRVCGVASQGRGCRTNLPPCAPQYRDACRYPLFSFLSPLSLLPFLG